MRDGNEIENKFLIQESNTQGKKLQSKYLFSRSRKTRLQGVGKRSRETKSDNKMITTSGYEE